MTPRVPRIAIVIDDLGHGGAQRQLFLIAESLRERARLQVIAFAVPEHPYAARLRAAGVDVTGIPRRSSVDLRRLRDLTATLRAFRPDVIHGFLDASNAYAYLAARQLRVPAVLSLRSDRLRARGVRSLALRAMLRAAAAVVTNSLAGHDYLVDHVGVASARVTHVPNIVVAQAPRPAPEDPLLVGCVGRLVALKRFDAVIEAVAIVRRTHPATTLLVVGDGPAAQDLRDAARALGVDDAVCFAGAVEDTAPLFARMACLVVASEHEGLPNAALEAMAAGVPVVAVPAGDLPRLVVDGVTGILATDASPPTLAAAITRALTDPALARTAAREGPRAIAAGFAPEIAAARLLELYSRLINEPGASTRV
ncbi:MAG TPA: glycosyltransferase family 4 protein [Candidatus Krumholzibacteria bacterium]|nr:glycosyltransferase family 4 protein [Candidatus Krumholzibacteria bacterium]